MKAINSERLISLDVFRGMTVAGMILVNSPGNGEFVYPQLAHAEWNGCTFADFIFPFFLFIVGVAVTFSLLKRKERGDSSAKLMLQVFRRSFIIMLLAFILGLFSKFDLSHIVFTGVLKRIAVVYFIISLIFLKTSSKTQAVIFGSLLIIYWGLLTLIPVPGVGKPNLGMTTNLSAWLDNLLMHGHLARGNWDPLGILSTIPAISTALLGVLTGHLLKSDKDKVTQTIYMFVAGTTLIVAGYLWGFWFPINKSLWSSSFVLFTGGFALNIFAVCFWLVDIKKYKSWTKPFLVFGMNAITVYFLAVLVGRILKLIKLTNDSGTLVNLKIYLYETIFLPVFDPMSASLVYALCYVLLWYGLMSILYKKKIFIKV